VPNKDFDAAKICAVDAMLHSVFLGTVLCFRMLCSRRSDRVYICCRVVITSTLPDVWSFDKVSVFSTVK
jgi:hypothetical protein